jgi:formate dehydrogenase subunit gamma
LINVEPFQQVQVRLSFEIAALLILVFIAFYAIHWLRRAFRPWPTPERPKEEFKIEKERVKWFDIVERLFHWTNFIVLGTIILTGVNIFIPGYLDIIFSAFGIKTINDSILLHTNFAYALLALIIIHIVWDTLIARGFWNIWIRISDFKDFIGRAENFLGISRKYPRDPKYDMFMKSYHWGLTISLVIQGITGLYFMNPFGLLPGLDYGIEYIFRILHDIFAFVIIGLIIGHIYFAILPANFEILRAMITGTTSTEFYLSRYDLSRWKVPAVTINQTKTGEK